MTPASTIRRQVLQRFVEVLDDSLVFDRASLQFRADRGCTGTWRVDRRAGYAVLVTWVLPEPVELEKRMDSSSMDAGQGGTRQRPSRWFEPRIVLFVAEHVRSLSIAELERLRLVAAYVHGSRVANELRAGLSSADSVAFEWPVVLEKIEEVESYQAHQMPILSLPSSSDTESQNEILEREKQFRMLGMIRRFVVHRPLYLVLAGPDDVAYVQDTIVKHVAAYDPTATVVVIGEGLPEAMAASPAESRPLVECFSTWQELTATAPQILVSADAVHPHVRVGDAQVSLAEIFRDPSLRLDDEWRIISTKAIGQPPVSETVGDLFQSLMSLDEQRDARSVEDDVREWWAIGAGLLYERTEVRGAIERVLGTLRGVKGAAYSTPSILWMPADPGSGATTALHAIALAAASEGYPTLVLKQAANEVDAERVGAFLTSLHRLAGSQVEQPALVVLDVQHRGQRTIDELPRHLVTFEGRQVVFVWALRSATHEDGAEGLVPIEETSASHDVVQDVLPDDARLPLLHSEVSTDEVERLRAHVSRLRGELGLTLPERDEATWRAYQESQGFSLPSSNAELVRSNGQRVQVKAESLFWILLHHFLSSRHGNPLQSAMRVRIDQYLNLAGSRGESIDGAILLGAALEVAKVSRWGVMMPVGALHDWYKAIGDLSSHVSTQQESSGRPVEQEGEAPDESAIELLRRKFAGELPEPMPTADDSWGNIYACIDHLVQDGVVREHVVEDTGFIRTRHRAIATLLVADAVWRRHSLPKPIDDGLGSGHGLGDAVQTFSSLSTLLSSLSVTSVNARFCEQVSELILRRTRQTTHDSDVAQARLDVYAAMPNGLRQQSRVLMHHHALALRDRVIADNEAKPEHKLRLYEARDLVRRAQDIPQGSYSRDDHPAHLLTTLGNILDSLGRIDVQQSVKFQEEARSCWAEALEHLPDSRHTRLALAESIDGEVQTRLQSDREEDHVHALRMGAQALELLGVDPTGVEERWYRVKHSIASAFGSDTARSLIEDLQRRESPWGFLLAAELREAAGERDSAIAVLKDSAQYDTTEQALLLRRLADLLFQRGAEGDAQEACELLLHASARVLRLRPLEDYRLACQEYQDGNYDIGRERFARLRAAGRDRALPESIEFPFIEDSAARARSFVGRALRQVEGSDSQGWMAISDGETGRQLFDAPFRPSHFVQMGRRIDAGAQFNVVIRLYRSGPRAVPARFAQSWSR